MIGVTVLICATVWLLSRSKRGRATMSQHREVSSRMVAFLISLLGGRATCNNKASSVNLLKFTFLDLRAEQNPFCLQMYCIVITKGLGPKY